MDEDLDAARALAAQIDDFFDAAAKEYSANYGEAAELVYATLQRSEGFGAVEFVDAYIGSGLYPSDRLEVLANRFTEVRLQLHYIKFDLGIANEHYYAPQHHSSLHSASPRQTLKLMAVDQSLIGRSRIAWEKLMRAVYFLETGTDLEPSGKRSYKAKFFTWVAEQPKWRFLAPYESVVRRHDDKYRNGEYHKGSILRPRILGRDTPGGEEFLALSNYMSNCIWPNIVSIVAGGTATQFTDLHMIQGSHEIDPMYLTSLPDEQAI
ncbi:hypothetical protein [Streptacidiphilus albus]|uniref:hypothetical protein n=1 Tax=Streptacidiphilus albus TaxID=105425 RepID=UPI00128BB945|nr:hypothetical protein [Streptacidiphilus albus]